jgi:uncharacterized membrane protein YfcA
LPAGETALVCAAILVVAVLYSSVGHAGASGYIAVMTLFGFSQGVIKPTALSLNVLVATIGSLQYWKAGHFSWSLFWPFAASSVPLAFLGGYVNLPIRWFKVLVGIVLLFSAVRFLTKATPDADTRPPSKGVSVAVGGGLGLLSGLTGTGGGIFLTPLLIFLRWARTKTASATSAVFILANSASGLVGNLTATKSFPAVGVAFAAAAVIGGVVGSYLGSRRFDVVLIKRLLAIVLTVAGIKLVLS